MKSKLRFLLTFILIFALVIAVSEYFPALLNEADTPPAATVSTVPAAQEAEADVREDGAYTQKDELALYIHLYGHLPDNFVTKAEAEAAGWKGGGVSKVLPCKSIGGDRFYNREGALPTARGRIWTECDVGDTTRERGPERIVFSNDGLVYYTPDHYDSFELLYGEP